MNDPHMLVYVLTSRDDQVLGVYTSCERAIKDAEAAEDTSLTLQGTDTYSQLGTIDAMTFTLLYTIQRVTLDRRTPR